MHYTIHKYFYTLLDVVDGTFWGLWFTKEVSVSGIYAVCVHHLSWVLCSGGSSIGKLGVDWSQKQEKDLFIIGQNGYCFCL